MLRAAIHDHRRRERLGRRAGCRGQTLMELIVASGIIATALVPALRLMRESMRISRDVETATLMTTLCASKLEEHLALSAGSWNPTTVTGDFAGAGYPQLRFQVMKSDSLSDGGMAGALMSVTAMVWEDANGDGSWSTGEARVIFASKLAKVLSYESEASEV